MMAVKLGESSNVTDDGICKVMEERNGVFYRCHKKLGHERIPGDEEHEAQSPEYAILDWRTMFEATRPILEWAAANASQVGKERNELARRILIRAFTAKVPHPGLTKAKK